MSSQIRSHSSTHIVRTSARVLALAADALGAIGCVVNNASLFEYDSAADFSPALLATHMQANVSAPILLHPDEKPVWELTHTDHLWDVDLEDGQTVKVGGAALKVLLERSAG